jgi:hypothetical protein
VRGKFVAQFARPALVVTAAGTAVDDDRDLCQAILQIYSVARTSLRLRSVDMAVMQMLTHAAPTATAAITSLR